MENLNISSLLFIKSKESTINNEHKINFIMLNNTKSRNNIILKNVKIPFGYEKYKNDIILNIEIDPKTDKTHNNYYIILSTFENEFTNKNDLSKLIRYDIEDKTYYPNMRESKDGFIIRTHIYEKPEIFSMIGGTYKMLMTSMDLKKTYVDIELELRTLWITNDNYGITWSVKKIEIKYSY
jgi:hypothetical protein